MPTLAPPIALALVPELLRARGLNVSPKKLGEALRAGAIAGKHERGRWLMMPDELDAAERYFRALAARGAWKGGAAALDRASGRQ